MKYCAVEGSSFAGKTTICTGLAKLGIKTIGEYDKYIKLNVAPETLDEHKAFIDALIQAERMRSTDVAKQSGEIVVSDRSILSLLTFDDMANKYGLANPAIGVPVREYLETRLEKEIYLGNIITINCVLVARLDDAAAFEQRVRSRGVTPVAQLADFKVSQYVTERAAYYGSYLLSESSVVQVDMSPYNKLSAAHASLDSITALKVGEFNGSRLRNKL